ncbi:hypothetical protein TBLA_0I02260 [Henningerozyma blattae CBS 6284]|uniref:O-acyltransferase n=1 Tax=Henningerozyma blattae (strain ATCC 34711 / CBS 6284 / DSM 70876 / NBRC 10599 / NRRL Y-10934 / UCD 77-7) TaxID=1071380 RepID=I2H932_HENB6|nr:hypothetical protein TBLA_0I02260 [Tetrapisispora blattae CBS 6284]CCH62884.1 hypothetical protein TBLA_0I02260 [Tetrapisispora blattae CBS 6284]
MEREQEMVLEKTAEEHATLHLRTQQVEIEPIPQVKEERHMNSKLESNVTTQDVKTHLDKLRHLKKVRTSKSTGKAISFFNDVKFANRPTIMDSYLKSHPFTGPIQENQVKVNEKMSSDKILTDTTHDNDQLFNTSFYGFYILFWMGLGFCSLKRIIDFYLDESSYRDSLFKTDVFLTMSTNLWNVFMLDLFLLVQMFVPFVVHYYIKSIYLKTNRIVWNSNYRNFFIFFELSFFFGSLLLIMRHSPGWSFNWISRIFLFLHSMVILMKMHSYTFYNSYLWNMLKDISLSKQYLRDSKIDLTFQETQLLEKDIIFANSEINSQSFNNNKDLFPQNITLKDFLRFCLFPVIIYQTEYPRNEKIRWGFVFEKFCATIGTIFLMMMVGEFLMWPGVKYGMSLRDTDLPLLDPIRILKWFNAAAHIIPGFSIMYILVFYLIWDALLNAIAELTRFGDRYFYGDWWNCVTWGEFSRIWNVPVHKFLLRYVYHSSITDWNFSKAQATWFTFILSAIFHELSMYVIFGRVRYYLFLFQLSQLPATVISENVWPFKNNPVLLNSLFWFGVCTGPTVICTLYLAL